MAEICKRHDAEFRAGAVRIVRETGKPVAQVVPDLGVNEGTLATWISREKEAAGPAWTRTRGPNLHGCARKLTSFGWNVMSSSDQWSCGSRRRRSDSCGLHRRPEDQPPGAARRILPGP
ncbi:transposase [Streptomyces sp. NPDC088560]|uniref:transposase n=1 Tax=Streptomyces sp. NPDC088560 TaxID=3365868 RepID=UPI0038069A26